ncbi:MAG: reverse transcriptase domain-containing protein [Thermomicrobiales bacterium]
MRYADDFVVLCKSRDEADRALRTVERLLAQVELRVNRGKTSISHFDDGFDFLDVHFEGDAYSYISDDKLIVVDGSKWPGWAEWFPPQPEGYV